MAVPLRRPAGVAGTDSHSSGEPHHVLSVPLFAILFWAGNVIVSKMAASAISPTAITFYRLVLALAIMGLFTAVPAWRNRKIILHHWPKLALYGALSSALFQALSYRAAETTTATNMAIVTALIPLLSMLLSVVVLRDPLTLGMAFGGVLSFLGLLYLVGQGDMLAVFHNGVHVGDGLMLLAAFSYALYGVLLRTGRCRCRPGNRLSCNRSSRCSTCCRCFSRCPQPRPRWT